MAKKKKKGKGRVGWGVGVGVEGEGGGKDGGGATRRRGQSRQARRRVEEGQTSCCRCTVAHITSVPKGQRITHDAGDFVGRCSR